MKDRVVQYPARYQLVPVAGTTDQFDLVAVPGTVTEAGSDINKANLLPDAICTALGIATTSEPKDALTALNALASGKAQVAVGSYSGTGTFGASNPNSLTFDFAPKIVWVYAKLVTSYSGYFATDMTGSYAPIANMSRLTTSYAKYGAPYGGNGESAYSKKSADGKTIYWYNTASATGQYNDSGFVYYYLAIG